MRYYIRTRTHAHTIAEQVCVRKSLFLLAPLAGLGSCRARAFKA